ncbi:hypothetical protein [Kitasatospora sp. NPDC091207]|uniref:hypothetical protein n=1 Tax=Kitasatospora sp. NPDC091207 TaxID=3364083 RepID=UPI00381AAB57
MAHQAISGNLPHAGGTSHRSQAGTGLPICAAISVTATKASKARHVEVGGGLGEAAALVVGGALLGLL